MHQTFYIDIDEEITSVVERLRKSRASEVILVIPKRALLIQSIVNLRLLKKEADGLGVSIMAVTQDKLGKLLIEKAGILVQQKFEGLDQAESPDSLPEEDINIAEYPKGDISEFSTDEENEGDRLFRIGSKDYFEKNPPSEKNRPPSVDIQKPLSGQEGDLAPEKLTNRELVAGPPVNIKDFPAVRPAVDSMVREIREKAIPEKPLALDPSAKKISSSVSSSPLGGFSPGPRPETVFAQDKKIENFFASSPPGAEETLDDQEKNKENPPEEEGSLTKKILIAFFLLAFLGAVAISGYFLLPKASVLILTEKKSYSEKIGAIGKADAGEVDFENRVVPLKHISISEEFSKNFPVSGGKSVSNQKSRGKIVILNEFGSSPQSLVASTRFLSEEGKLFRLVKGVTVPGMKKEGGETIAGKVEAEVAADEGGESFNIGPSRFSIPGFKENSDGKYEKIYAKSESGMTGGGESISLARAVSKEDIEKAKKEALSELDGFIAEKISQKAGEGFQVPLDFISRKEPTYKISNSPGDVVSNFEVAIQTEAEALVFNENKLKSLAGNILEKSQSGQNKLSENAIELSNISFGRPDFEKKSADIEFLAKGNLIPAIDSGLIRKEIIGKSNEELETYLSKYPEIEKAEVIYWPPFLSSRIPLWEKRIEVEIR